MVEVRREGAVARIFLNRPQKVNALDSAMLERLASALEEAGADDTVRAYLCGWGDARCAEAERDRDGPARVGGRVAAGRTARRTQKGLLQQWGGRRRAGRTAARGERCRDAHANGGPLARVARRR